MEEILKNILNEYKEIRLKNIRDIKDLELENLMINCFERDLRLISNRYEDKIKKLEEQLKLTKFSYDNCLKALAETDNSLKEYLEKQKVSKK